MFCNTSCDALGSESCLVPEKHFAMSKNERETFLCVFALKQKRMGYLSHFLVLLAVVFLPCLLRISLSCSCLPRVAIPLICGVLLGQRSEIIWNSFIPECVSLLYHQQINVPSLKLKTRSSG